MSRLGGPLWAEKTIRTCNRSLDVRWDRTGDARGAKAALCILFYRVVLEYVIRRAGDTTEELDV